MVSLRQQQRRRRYVEDHIVFTVQGATTFDPTLTLSVGAPTPTWWFVDDPGIGTLTGAAISQAVGAGTHRVVLGPLALYPYITALSANTDALIGQIPQQIFDLTNLTTLYLYTNQLTGAIPAEIGDLTNMAYLSLATNQLTGAIPAEIGSLTNLISLSLYTNQLTGAIPAEIGDLTNLTTLSLGDNQLTGAIPAEIGSLTNLTALSLGINQLTGAVPVEIGSLTSLTSLYLYTNQLTGIEVGAFAGLTAIHALSISNNGMAQADVDVIVADIWGARASYTYATPSLSIGGSNADPSGNYVAPPGGGASNSDWFWNGATYEPLTGLAMVYDLVNDVNTEGFNKWAVTY